MKSERVVLGMDIGGTGMRAALVNESGKIVGKFIDEDRDSDTFGHIKKVITELIEVSRENGCLLVAIGMGIAGLVDPETEVLVSSPTMTSMEGTNFRALVNDFSGLPVFINNDANCAGFAEWKSNDNLPASSAIAMFVGTGVGGAIILDNKLYKGRDGVAGEIGHIVVSSEGPECPCGGSGCLEQLGSGTAVERYVTTQIQQGRQSTLNPILAQRRITGKDVLKAAQEGDSLSIEAYEEVGKWLGIAVASLTNLLNIELAIIGGGAMVAQQFIMPKLLERVDKHTMSVQRKTLSIETNKLGREAGTLGAALLAFAEL